jgi:hypothetical protein
MPDYLSPEWHEYVMGEFSPDELVDDPKKPDVKYPTVAGLRRVAEKLLGRIIKSGPDKIFPVTDPDDIRATVSYVVRFLPWDQSPIWYPDRDNEPVVEYSEVADACVSNTDATFLSFAVATASTRAEARALRKALKLKVCSADEIPKLDPARAVAKNSDSLIADEQVSLIKKKCKALDLDIQKFANSGEKQYRSIFDVTKETATKMIKALVEYTNDKNSIPPEIKGYSSDWQ